MAGIILFRIPETVWFVLFVTLVIYLPGRFVNLSLSLKPKSYLRPFLDFMTGIVMFTLTAYAFAWLRADFLTPAALIVTAVISVIRFPFGRIRLPPNFWYVFTFLIVCAVLFSLPLTLTGRIGDTFLQRGDDLVHLSYINEFRFAFPPQNPNLAGTRLLGYHFFYDFLVARISVVSHISPLSVYYQLMPLTVSFLWALGSYSLLKQWAGNNVTAVAGTLLIMFGGSFGYILGFLGHPAPDLSSVFGINQPASALLNVPFAFSVPLILSVIGILFEYYRTGNRNIPYLLIPVVGSSPMFKIYAAMIVFSAMGIFTLMELFRGNYRILLVDFGIALTAGLTYGLFSVSGSGLTYYPLWPVYRMLELNLPWYGFTEKMYTFTRLHVVRGIISVHAYGLLLFFVGNIGTRFIGIILISASHLVKKKLPSRISVTVITMGLASVGIPLFFIQTIKGFEMIQMTWYYPLFCSIPAAFGIGLLAGKKYPLKFRVITGSVLFFLTVPSAYENYARFIYPLLSIPRVSVNSPVMKAMTFLQTHGTYDDTVLEIPPKDFSRGQDVDNWYRNVSTMFIPALGNKRVYISDRDVDYPGLDVGTRLKILAQVLDLEFGYSGINRSDTVKETYGELRKAGIKYIYSPGPLASLKGLSQASEVFGEAGYYIYELR
ncbi:hypothetical protein A2Z33_05110 [Candidatus Gottesmanbacteria bacterium RBG_16_52_11]|uniref:Uncharacterized protein n=1 Tax=Candidatus Gottesmanbacteria bacterium RBG_16_52_11 TaxID=1798374 RepID=A0A1F5YQD6_9BACT|nr:MAG: hypothetical protein A2Z33_05110 [Candidatus Gottesmanbacteria bacterium RBG_16_52_11]